jgi:hypothetical protein
LFDVTLQLFVQVAMLRRAPVRLNPTLIFDAIERGVDRALADLQNFFGDPLDALATPQPCMGSRVSVFRMSRLRVPCRRSVEGGMVPLTFDK